MLVVIIRFVIVTKIFDEYDFLISNQGLLMHVEIVFSSC
jgi:hypothetical protein